MTARTFQFGPFRLDVRERRLACETRPVPLRGKVFDTLCVLVENAGSLLRKDELMKAIWPDSVVEENNLEHNLCVLRKILGANGGGRKFIETVPRQGYRFVGDVRAIDAIDEAPAAPHPAMHLVGPPAFIAERDFEMRQLQSALDRASLGARQVVFLTGEAGIGKTTLVNNFLAGIADFGPMQICLGECIDQRGPGEAYMPVLEALARLCRQSGGPAIVEILKQRAPTWLCQVPSATSPEELRSLQHSLIGLTQERMLREGVDVFQAIATSCLLVLVLEDLHWSDASTLDFLNRIARGRGPARLLVIGTYRPAEAGGNRAASVSDLAQRLRLGELCRELPLGFLSERGIAGYLENRLQGTPPPAAARLLHHHTEGNPLFVSALVNSWIGNGLLRRESAGWVLLAASGDVALEAPETLRRVIESQVDQLPPAEREIVQAASVAGVEFCSSAVAAALGRNPSEVETQCAAMARGARFFAACGQTDWPDGSVCQRFRFIHGLYRDAIYRRQPAGLRARRHLEIGEHVERAVAGHEDQFAGELARHFQQARDARRAIHYLKTTARQCMERGAAPDAVFYLTSALEMLRRIPEQQERTRLELGIDALLAPALGASKGFGDRETEAAFRRAYELARQMGEEERRFPIVFGFAVMLELRGQFRKAQEFMEKYLPGEELRGGFLLEGLDLLACSHFHQGAFADALKYAERGVAACRPESHSALSGTLGENPIIDCYCWQALALWFLGDPDRALAQADRAVTIAEGPSYSYSRAATWTQRAFLHQLRREVEATASWSGRAIALAVEHGYPYREAVGKVLHGWAMARMGKIEPGIAELKAGIEGCRASGAELDRPYHLALLAEAHLLARDHQSAAAALREAIQQVESARSFFYEAELWRLQGVLLRTVSLSAGECFLRSIRAAQAQQARSLELRAAVDLARLLREEGDPDRATGLLAPIYNKFAGATETPDLRAARLELEALEKIPAKQT